MRLQVSTNTKVCKKRPLGGLNNKKIYLQKRPLGAFKCVI